MVALDAVSPDCRDSVGVRDPAEVLVLVRLPFWYRRLYGMLWYQRVDWINVFGYVSAALAAGIVVLWVFVIRPGL